MLRWHRAFPSVALGAHRLLQQPGLFDHFNHCVADAVVNRPLLPTYFPLEGMLSSPERARLVALQPGCLPRRSTLSVHDQKSWW